MNGHVVADASVVVKWLIDEDDFPLARALADMWTNDGTRVAAPHLLLSELTNALHRQVVRGHLEAAEAIALVGAVLAYRFELHYEPRLYPRALAIASELNQRASYDSLYLALAESLDCELWTADARFHGAARGQYPRVRLLAEFNALA